jgi:hypothetical protein
MRATLLTLMVIVFFACDDGNDAVSKDKSSVPSNHSPEFNRSVQAILNSYYQLTDAFVRWDSASLPSLAASLGKSLDSLSAEGNDSADMNYIAQSSRQVSYILADNTLEEKRHALQSLTENLVQFLHAVEYDQQKLYLQECPMAFNDTEAATWISAEDSIRNPYLGLYHPRYGKGMLKCGENKEVIDHTAGNQ